MKTLSFRQAVLALCLCATTLAGCGGGGESGEGLLPLLVALIRAQFVPATQALANEGTVSVQLVVRCDRASLNTAFARLQVRVKLDPQQRLPNGVQATLVQPAPFDSDGFQRYPCVNDTPDPEVKQVALDVTVSAAAGSQGGRHVLQALVDIEPLIAGQPSRDSTLAELDLDIETAPPGFGLNLLVNPAFDGSVGTGSLPSAPGNWTGDVAAVLPSEQGITPRSGATMLKFVATGATFAASALQSSQQWQLLDVHGLAADIATGRVRADGSVWFNRVLGTEATDRRFDLRLVAFDGDAATVPARYANSGWLAVQAVSLATAGNQWQQALASLVLPPGTTHLLVEIYAYEDVVNDSSGSEFSGHYADDASLVLTLLP